MAIDRQQLPGAGHAPQLDAAAVLEGAGPDDQVADGARDEDFARAASPRMRAPMWTASPRMSAAAAPLAGVEAGADLDAQCLGVSVQDVGAPDGRLGPSKVARRPSPAEFTTAPPMVA